MNQEMPFPAAGPAPAGEEARGGVLIVDDEVFIRDALQLYLETLGFTVQAAENGEQALEIFTDPLTSVDLVILDLVMPGIAGIELLKIFKVRDPTVEVIITTGCGSMGTAIEALRHGAFDYITKPIVNFDEDLLKVVQEAMKIRRQRLRQSVKAQAYGEEGTRERLLFLERLIDLAAEANRSRQGDPELERIEEIIRKGFEVTGGMVLCRGPSGQAAPIYSWGFSCPLSSPGDRTLDPEIAAALLEGTIRFFPVASLDPGWVGVPAEDLAGWERFACLPLITQGNFWGNLIFFFGPQVPFAAQPPERHPFQVLVPILSSVFSGALRYPRPA